jgi:hypothetical protein
MSNDAYQRSNARESKFWKPFSYSFPFSADQTTDRVIIYGLYSDSHLNQHGYLIEVEATDLLNMLNDYNSKISNLNMQEQNVLADIVAKRYLAGIDKLIHDEKMITEGQKISAQDAEWTAKITALDTDRAALVTLAARVTSETAKINARITELQAYIETEGYARSEVDIEIASKEIQLAEKDIAILDAANAILKIQLEVVNKGMELVDIDLQKVKTQNEIESIKRSIARTGLLESELEVEQAQTVAATAEKELYISRTTLAGKRVDAANKEADLYGSLVTHETEIGIKKVDERDADQTRKLSSISDREDSALFNTSLKKDAADFDATTITDGRTVQEKLDQDKINIDTTQAGNKFTINAATITAATLLAAALISTELTHTIQKKVT